MGPPQQLRDMLWADATVMTGPSFKGADLGQVIIPAVYPFSWKDPDESVWLGRTTVWNADDHGKEYPSGQKVFLVDGEEFPLLEVRELEFQAPPLQNSASAPRNRWYCRKLLSTNCCSPFRATIRPARTSATIRSTTRSKKPAVKKKTCNQGAWQTNVKSPISEGDLAFNRCPEKTNQGPADRCVAG